MDLQDYKKKKNKKNKELNKTHDLFVEIHVTIITGIQSNYIAVIRKKINNLSNSAFYH